MTTTEAPPTNQPTTVSRSTNDWLTVAAIATLVGLISVSAHEAGGHGLAVLLAGGQVDRITSVAAEFNEANLSLTALRWIAAAGMIANIIVGGIAWSLLLAVREQFWRYFLWLLGFSNLLVAGGYPLALSFTSFGDIHDMVKDLANPLPWQIVSTIIGIAFSVAILLVALRLMQPFLGNEERERQRHAWQLTLPAYLAIGLTSVLAGALNPTDPILILISAATSSFGGNAFLFWLPLWVHRARAVIPPPLLMVQRNWGWIVAGVLALLVRLVVLGPGIPRS